MLISTQSNLSKSQPLPISPIMRYSTHFWRSNLILHWAKAIISRLWCLLPPKWWTSIQQGIRAAQMLLIWAEKLSVAPLRQSCSTNITTTIAMWLLGLRKIQISRQPQILSNRELKSLKHKANIYNDFRLKNYILENKDWIKLSFVRNLKQRD